MKFDQAWTEILGPMEANLPPDAIEALRTIALAFYKAGEVQGVTNVNHLVMAATEAREAMDKKAKERLQ